MSLFASIKFFFYGGKPHFVRRFEGKHCGCPHFFKSSDQGFSGMRFAINLTKDILFRFLPERNGSFLPWVHAWEQREED